MTIQVRRGHVIGTAMMITAASFFGVGDVFIKAVYLHGADLPLNLALFRIWVSALIFLPVIVGFRGHRVLLLPRRALKISFAFGAAAAAFEALFFFSLAVTTVTNATLLMFTNPASVAILSSFILRERVTTPKLVGIALSLIGASLVVGLPKGVELFSSTRFLGDLLALASGVAVAFLYIIGRMQSSEQDPFATLLYAFIFATLFITPIVASAEGVDQMGLAPAWVFALGTVIVSSAGYLLYLSSLKLIEATKGSIYGLFEPLVASIIASIVLSEAVDIYTGLGGALILSAVFMVYSKG